MLRGGKKKKNEKEILSTKLSGVKNEEKKNSIKLHTLHKILYENNQTLNIFLV